MGLRREVLRDYDRNVREISRTYVLSLRRASKDPQIRELMDFSHDKLQELEENIEKGHFQQHKRILAAKLGVSPERVRYVDSPDPRDAGKMDYNPFTGILHVYGSSALARAVLLGMYVPHERHHIFSAVSDDAVEEVLASLEEIKRHYGTLRAFLRGEEQDPKKVANALHVLPRYFDTAPFFSGSGYAEHVLYHVIPVANVHREDLSPEEVRKQLDSLKRIPLGSVIRALPHLLAVRSALPLRLYWRRRIAGAKI